MYYICMCVFRLDCCNVIYPSSSSSLSIYIYIYYICSSYGHRSAYFFNAQLLSSRFGQSLDARLKCKIMSKLAIQGPHKVRE